MSERLNTPYQAAVDLFNTGMVEPVNEESKAILLKLATGLIEVFQMQFRTLRLQDYLNRPDALGLIGPHGADFMQLLLLQALRLTLDTDPEIEKALNLSPKGSA